MAVSVWGIDHGVAVSKSWSSEKKRNYAMAGSGGYLIGMSRAGVKDQKSLARFHRQMAGANLSDAFPPRTNMRSVGAATRSASRYRKIGLAGAALGASGFAMEHKRKKNIGKAMMTKPQQRKVGGALAATGVATMGAGIASRGKFGAGLGAAGLGIGATGVGLQRSGTPNAGKLRPFNNGATR